jgi:titin
VPNLVEGTSYEFRVIAENRSGRSDPSPSSAPVIIREPVSGKGPIIREHLTDAYARLGSTAEFECRVSGEPLPKITWTKDYQKLVDGRKYMMKYRDAVASLAIHDVVDKDQGLYTCEATNLHGFATSSAALHLKEPPRLTVDDRFRKLHVHVGGTAKVTVGLEGDPPPTVTWYKDGLQLKSKPNVFVDATDFSTTITVKRMSREDAGEYEVVAKNEWGTTKERFTIKVMDVPTAPANLRTSDIRSDSISLDWTKPRSDGGSPITSYIIERRDTSTNYWTRVGSVDGHHTSFIVPNLRPGAEYHLQVFAENDMGVSEPCTMSMPVRLPGPQPAAPSASGLLPSVGSLRHTDLFSDSVTLEWEPPMLPEARHRLKSYVVERYAPEPPPPRWERLATVPSSVTRYTVPGLSPGQRYKFRVFGETDEGLMGSPYEYEPPQFSPHLGELPYRPIGPIIVSKVSASSLELEWRPPLSDGGSPVIGYVIEMTESGSGAWVKVGYVPSRETRFTVAGLTEGGNYFFRVFAESHAGLSRPLQSDCVTPSQPVAAPAVTSRLKYGRVRRDSVTLEWETSREEETSTTISGITGYLIEKRDVSKETWLPVKKVAPKVKAYEVPGLLTGHQYTFRVRPIGAQGGLGEAIMPEAPITVTSQYKTPSQPRGPVSIFNITSNSAEIRWNAPDDTGGAPLISYIIEIREATRSFWRRAATVSATSTAYTLRDLTPGAEYVVRIMAKNQEGESSPLTSDFIAVPRAGAPPSAPSMLKVVRVTGDSVTLQWSPPYGDGGSDVTRYVILKKSTTAGGLATMDDWEEAGRVSGSTTTFTVPRLRDGRPYYFAVYAVNRAGNGDVIETARPITPKKVVSKPIAPVGPLTIHAFSHDSVTISWLPPDPMDIGSISGYRIEKREVSQSFWDVVGNTDASETSYTVRGLRAGTDYYFRVIAENGAGASAPLTLDRSFIPRTPYDKPSAPRGPLEVSDVTRSTLTLSWLPPLSDGGAAIIAYVVERREKTSPLWSRVARVKPQTTTCTVTNLNEHTEYFFRVYAENIEGTGAPLTLESAFAPRKPSGKPSSPSGHLRARKTGDSVLLEWNAAYDDGGSRVTSYVVEYKDIDSIHWQRAAVVDGFTRSVVVQGLRDAAVRDYVFRVYAVNEYGQSEPLETDVTVRPSRLAADVPSAPRGPLAVSDILRNSMTLSWQPPLTDGNSPVTAYIIERQDITSPVDRLGGWTRVDRVKSHIYTYSVAHLVDGHRYMYRVIAENEHGRGPALETRNAIEAKSPFAVPGPPTSIRLIGITEDTVTIEWTAPTSDGGRPVIRYVVEKREANSQFWSPVKSVSVRTTLCQVTNLLPNCAYYLRVAAENDEGIGFYREFVEPVKPMKPKNLPMAPANLRVDGITRDSVTLRWDAPKDTGGVPLSGYIIEQQDGKLAPGSSARWRVAAYVDPARSWWTIGGLIQGYEYWFRVRAENPDGAGPACSLPSAIIPKPVILKPSAPVLLEVVGVTEDSVTLSWLSPERDGGSRIHGYVIEKREVGTSAVDGWTRVKRIDSSEILVACIEGLRDGSAYRFRVYAENEAGSGPAVELREPVVPRSQLGPPSMPDGPIRVIRVTRNMLAIHWSPPYDNGGYPIERYIVEKREATHSHWTQVGVCSPDVTAYCITDLAENQIYYFRVIAETAYGFSDPLELDKPVVPRRIFETAPMMEIESWMGDTAAAAGFDITETTRTQQQQYSSLATTERTYSAYADEPLTSTQDTISATQAWLLTRRH